MLHFDPKTRQKYEHNPATLIVSLISGGCEGMRIEVNAGEYNPSLVPLSHNLGENSQVFVMSQDFTKIDEGYVTWTGEKWILKHNSILTRCGCGKSFSYSTGNAQQDKLRLIRSKLKKVKHIHS